ncbi:hypothetical protein J3Q64DRAFT_1701931 [Phycomyces blakesleeanus]
MAQHSFQLVTILATISTVITNVHASPLWVANDRHEVFNKRAESSEASAASSKHAESTHSKAESTPTPTPTTTTTAKHTTVAKEAAKESTKESTKESAHPTTTTKKSASSKASSTASSGAKAHESGSANSATGSGVVAHTVSGSASPSSTGAGAISNSAQSETASSGMSSGAVGGIIAAVCVVVVGALAFVMVRRKRKARGVPKNLKPDPFTMGFGSHNPPPHESMSSFNNPSAYATMTPTLVAAAAPLNTYSTEKVAAQPIPAMDPYINDSENESLGIFTVMTTYMPTLSDELEIQPGDRVNMLMEFDDGWCRGINLSRGNELGVFPRYCVEQTSAPTQTAPKTFTEKENDRTKRVSSMYMG